MNSLIYEFYKRSLQQEDANHSFADVIYLDEKSEVSLEKICQMSPGFPKGWWELCQLHVKDRIEFVQEFWKINLPYVPNFDAFLSGFFASLDDIGVFLTKRFSEEKYNAEMVYSVKGAQSFFRGKKGASSEELHQFACYFNNALPSDYLSFLKVHNGFAKNFDIGLFDLYAIKETTNQLRSFMRNSEKPLSCNHKHIDPNSLIPFYVCPGKGDFQCFYLDWYPGLDVGNVYYSSVDNTICDYHYVKNLSEQLAFSSFFDWLIFYLEEIQI